MRDRRLTARSLVESYLRRIEAYDQASGLQRDRHRQSRGPRRGRRPRHGIPQNGELRPLHGSPSSSRTTTIPRTCRRPAARWPWKVRFPRTTPSRSGGSARRRRSFWPNRTWPSGRSALSHRKLDRRRHPQSLRPERVPAGSSGGTAAAVAASFGAVGLGTDTGNSIRGPSSHCALVGIRPTMGLTSRDGIIPLYLRNDVGGPMARTVEDAARVLDAIAGPDPADPVTERGRGKVPKTIRPSSTRTG